MTRNRSSCPIDVWKTLKLTEGHCAETLARITKAQSSIERAQEALDRAQSALKQSEARLTRPAD